MGSVEVGDDLVADELEITEKLGDGINNLSLGITPCEVSPDGSRAPVPLVPLGLAAAIAATGDSGIVVAAAGNHGDENGCDGSQYPAALSAGAAAWEPFIDAIDAIRVAQGHAPVDTGLLEGSISAIEAKTVSVGAVESPQDIESRAEFSGCDDATVWAPGTHILSDYDGAEAAWDGTSFATPQIAGLIALGLEQP